jgi:NADH:ubiquinone oxidoreductase subunit 6 (subunit J)
MVLYFELFFIYFFFVCGICCSFFVVFSINPIHSILFLILVFFNISGILILLGLEYFALIFIIIYVGAISVLFLFIIMMLNIRIIELKDNL